MNVRIQLGRHTREPKYRGDRGERVSEKRKGAISRSRDAHLTVILDFSNSHQENYSQDMTMCLHVYTIHTQYLRDQKP